MMNEQLVRAFDRNRRIVHAQADGLTHAQSLTQTDYNVNCFNWVVGHIVSSRADILGRLGGDRVMSPEQADPYERESEPITGDGPGVIPLEELLGMLDRTQDAFAAMLDGADDAWLAQETPITEDRTSSRLSQLLFIYFHDTYHTGQTDLLRQMSGFDDAII